MKDLEDSKWSELWCCVVMAVVWFGVAYVFNEWAAFLAAGFVVFAWR